MMVHSTRHLASVDHRMAAVVRRVGPCTLTPRRQRFQSLVRAIVGQQISTKAARSVFERLRRTVGGYVTASRVAILTNRQLLGVGLSRQKAAYLRDLSARVVSGAVRLNRLDHLDDEAIIRKLTAVKGIGRWTAEMFLMFVLNRPDVLPVADLGLQDGFRRVYGLRRRPTAERMRQLAESWRPYRTVGSWYLWRYLDVVPEDY